MTNFQRIVLASRPQGEAGLEHFRLEEVPHPVLQDGQVRVRHHWLSLDPYMRMRMNAGKSYAAPVEVGAVMVGGTAGEVAESRHPGYAVGDRVVGFGGWQQYSVVDAAAPGALRKHARADVPLAATLGVCGMPGITAWIGLKHFIEPRAGETVVVSAASGAVGGVVGQLAKAMGCRAVGIAGGPEKCAYVVDTLGFDACIDHKAHRDEASLGAAVAAACPQGVDGNFENVGGIVLDAVVAQMNAFGRIALCGVISGYEGESIPLRNARLLLTQRLRLQGFIVSEHLPLWPAARAELEDGVAAGRIRYRETVADGLANAPAAFLGMLKGRNFGKQLVKLA